MKLIDSILNHPAISPHIQDDSGMHGAIDHESIYWLSVNKNQGCFMIHPHNFICYEVHTCLKPEIAGMLGRKAAKDALDWVFKNTPCQKLITLVPSYNLLAKSFAKKIGFEIEGINRKSYLRNGELLDQYMLGITKEDYLCQQQQ